MKREIGPRHCAGVVRSIINGGSCSLGLSKSHINRYKKYADLADELEAGGCNKDDVYQYVSVSVAVYSRCKGQPNITSLKRSSPVRKRMMDFLFNCVISKKYALSKDLKRASGEDTEKWSKSDYMTHYRDELFEGMSGNLYERLQGSRAVAKHNLALGTNKTPITIRGCAVECDPPHRDILIRMNLAGYGDNEYTAFCIALKWASERLESEKATKEAQP